MKDMFFMGIKGVDEPDFNALREAANEKISEAEFSSVSVCSAVAVHEDSGAKGEKGVVVILPDGDKANFYRALGFKEMLRHGTYTVLLNESSLPNCSFKALAGRCSGRSLEVLAEQWRDAASVLKEETGVFVAGLVYETKDGFMLVGNANPTMAGDMFRWQRTAEDLCRRLGTGCPEFYQAELRPASVLPRHRRIGLPEEEKETVAFQGIH